MKNIALIGRTQVMLCLAALMLSASALAQDLRLGVSGSLSGVVSLDGTLMLFDIPSSEGTGKFGVRAEAAARLAALGVPSFAGSVVLDSGPADGVAAHVGAGLVLMRTTGPAADYLPSTYLFGGLEWPVSEHLRLRLEGSVVPRANAAGLGLGLVVLPFGGER